MLGSNPQDENLIKAHKMFKSQVRDILYSEEVSIVQKCRINQLLQGDANSKLFLASLKQRRQTNVIQRLHTESSGYDDTKEAMEKVAVEYCTRICSTSPPTSMQSFIVRMALTEASRAWMS